MVKPNGSTIAGMAVLSADDEEAVFVNMIGNIRPEMFNDILDGVDADVEVPEIELQEPHASGV